ncbi:MAG: nucleotide exchange factor GrpE [Pseudomonadota bacterium]
MSGEDKKIKIIKEDDVIEINEVIDKEPELEDDEKTVEINEIDELRQLLQRTKADFDNFRKKVDEDKAKCLDYGREEVLTEIIDVYLNLKCALGHCDKETANNDEIIKGVKLTIPIIEKIFDKFGMEEIESIGKDFDYKYHEAIATEPVSNEDKNDVVLKEVSPGFLRKKKLFIPARVIVGKYQK